VNRPFRVLGVQQVAIGSTSRQSLRRLWVEELGIAITGHFRSERENVDEDICTVGSGAAAVEIDLMQPLDPDAKPAVHLPPLNHIGLWIDDLAAAVSWLGARGVRFAPGGIRKGAAGHDVCFIHPRGNEAAPIGGEGVLIELVQAPAAVIRSTGAAQSEGAMRASAALQWQPGPSGSTQLALPENGDLHLWRIDLEAPEDGGARRSILSMDERARAARFVFDRDRNRYIASRAALRRLLGRYLDADPAGFEIGVHELGRPYLAGAQAGALEFNVSHSEAQGLIGFARRGPLGVDLEVLRPVTDIVDLSERLYVEREKRVIFAADDAGARLHAFLTCWTRKEAVLKSTGLGLSLDPISIEAGAAPVAEDLSVTLATGPLPLHVVSFAVGPEAVGACATAPGTRIAACFDF
jgi:lactoylglutathione lyase